MFFKLVPSFIFIFAHLYLVIPSFRLALTLALLAFFLKRDDAVVRKEGAILNL